MNDEVILDSLPLLIEGGGASCVYQEIEAFDRRFHQCNSALLESSLRLSGEHGRRNLNDEKET